MEYDTNQSDVMASKDYFCRLLEINHLVCNVNIHSDSIYPVIFEIFHRDDLSNILVAFGIRKTELPMHDKYKWAHEKLISWIMKQNGQL